VEAAQRHGVDGIAFTYSELAVWLEYVMDVSRLARTAGLFTVYVSNSFVCDCAEENLPVAAYLSQDPAQVHAAKKCVASCCGDDGVLLKKYENDSIRGTSRLVIGRVRQAITCGRLVRPQP
jgi:hypothetical protein